MWYRFFHNSHSHGLFYGDFHAEQESEIRFSLAQLLALHFLSF